MKNNRYIFIYFVLIIMTLWSCGDDVEREGLNDPAGENCISAIMVSLPESELKTDTRASDDSDTEEIDGWKIIDTKNYQLSDIKEFNIEFNENTVIFVSQMTSEIPAFKNEDGIYPFYFIPNSESANWEEGYNFRPIVTDNPLEWFKIGNGGTYHGGFALYALHFPLETKIRQKLDEDNSIIYGVMEDQRTRENLIKSDILGAYHSTPTLFSRLRFKLHHMMAYLRVRLYVPVYNDSTHTGFQENAINYGTLEHVSTDFAVEWSANRSPDSQGPALVPLKGDRTIYMYQHPIAEGSDEHAKGLVKYKDFIGDNYYDQGIEGDYDKVRIYDFSVLLPTQKSEIDENGEEISFLSSQFLNFYVRSNSGAINRYYFSQKLIQNATDSNSSTQTGGSSDEITDPNSESSSGSLQIKEENIQYLQLYLPRVGNQIIFVTASVNPWKQQSTSLTLIETPKD